MTQTRFTNTDTLSRYMAEVNRFPLLSREEELELALAYRDHNDTGAANKLVTANLRFVVKVAYKYKNYGLNITDLIQEGNIGLMKAVVKFDPDRGYRLISYGVWWIKAYMQAYVIRSWSLVKIGTTQAQRKLFYKLKQTKRKLEAEGRPVTAAAIAEELGVKESAVTSMEMRMAGRDFSLDKKVSTEEGATTHLDLLVAENANQEEEYLDAERIQLLRRVWDEIICELSEKEQFVVRHRLMADKAMTLQSIGDHFGVSRERIRQIEGNAKKKIRRQVVGNETVLAFAA